MTVYRLRGSIDSNGQLQLDLPDDIPAGDVDVVISTRRVSSAPDWTDDELDAVLQVTPKSGSEIVSFLSTLEPAYTHIADSADWVAKQREQRRQQSSW